MTAWPVERCPAEAFTRDKYIGSSSALSLTFHLWNWVLSAVIYRFFQIIFTWSEHSARCVLGLGRVLEATLVINRLSEWSLVFLLAISLLWALWLLEILGAHDLGWMNFTNALSEFDVISDLAFAAVVELGYIVSSSSVAIFKVNKVRWWIKLSSNVQAIEFC